MNARWKSSQNSGVIGLILIAGAAASTQAALSAPAGLTAQPPAVFNGSVLLAWQNTQALPSLPGVNIGDLIGIGIHRSINNGAWSRIALITPSATQRSISSIQRQVNYRFRIRLEPAGGFSAYNSQRVSLGLPPLNSADYTSPYSTVSSISLPPVAPPSNLACVSTAPTSITVTWQQNEPGNLTSTVRVSLKNLVTSEYQLVSEHSVPAGPPTLTIPNLQPNQRYGIQVRTIDALFNASLFSARTDCATLASTPMSLRGILVSDGKIHLSWIDHAENSGVQIHRAVGSGGFSQIDADPNQDGVNIVPAGSPGCVLTNGITNDICRFSVRAVNLDGVAGGFSGTTMIATGPNPPANRVVIRNGAQLQVGVLQVDGREMLMSGRRIPVGGTGTIVMTSASHTLHAELYNKLCGQNTFEFPGEGALQSFTVLASMPVEVQIPAITLAGALARGTGYFSAYDETGNQLWFFFDSDGSVTYGVGFALQTTGVLSGSYTPGISTFQVTFQHGSWSGVFDECHGTITFYDDLTDDFIEFTRVAP